LRLVPPSREGLDGGLVETRVIRPDDADVRYGAIREYVEHQLDAGFNVIASLDASLRELGRHVLERRRELLADRR
jgi:hypothetical protein